MYIYIYIHKTCFLLTLFDAFYSTQVCVVARVQVVKVMVKKGLRELFRRRDDTVNQPEHFKVSEIIFFFKAKTQQSYRITML